MHNWGYNEFLFWNTYVFSFICDTSFLWKHTKRVIWGRRYHGKKITQRHQRPTNSHRRTMCSSNVNNSYLSVLLWFSVSDYPCSIFKLVLCCFQYLIETRAYLSETKTYALLTLTKFCNLKKRSSYMSNALNVKCSILISFPVFIPRIICIRIITSRPFFNVRGYSQYT
jgi:hypothetical protein